MDRPWDFLSTRENVWYCWELNGSRVWLNRRGSEWRYATHAKTKEGLDPLFGGPTECAEPVDSVLSLVIAKPQRMALRPTMINKPVVIHALNTVSILPNQDLDITVELPVSFHFEGEGGEVLCKLNTFNLHRTWFGDSANGTLCFSWPEILVPVKHTGKQVSSLYGSMLYCPIRIRNHSRIALVLEHLAVYTEMLDIWEVHGQLRTDIVVLEGLADGTLRMATQADLVSRSGTKLYATGLGHTELLVKRGVSFLRSIS